MSLFKMGNQSNIINVTDDEKVVIDLTRTEDDDDVIIDLTTPEMKNKDVEEKPSILLQRHSGEKPEEPCSDEEDESKHYEWTPEESFASNDYVYQVIERLGQGSFGTVLKCSRCEKNDAKENSVTTVAVKVVKSGKDRTREAHEEAGMLLKVGRAAGEFVIKMEDFFTHGMHSCIAMELLDVSLDAYLRETAKEKMPLAAIRRVISDALNGLAKLKELNIIHADVKPDNMMMNRRTFQTKLIDFGLAHHKEDRNSEPYIQTRPYRAPEIILQSFFNYDHDIDTWSLGCTMGELLTYRRLYPGKCNYDQLRYILDGQDPAERIEAYMCLSAMKDVYFTKSEDGATKLKTTDQFLAEINKYENVKTVVPAWVVYKRCRSFRLSSIEKVNMPELDGEDLEEEKLDRRQFADLLRKMLAINMWKRIDPRKALQHPFITMVHLYQYRHLERVKKSYELMDRSVPTHKRPRGVMEGSV